MYPEALAQKAPKMQGSPDGLALGFTLVPPEQLETGQPRPDLPLSPRLGPRALGAQGGFLGFQGVWGC